jgi:hypothetical protein
VKRTGDNGSLFLFPPLKALFYKAFLSMIGDGSVIRKEK